MATSTTQFHRFSTSNCPRLFHCDYCFQQIAAAEPLTCLQCNYTKYCDLTCKTRHVSEHNADCPIFRAHWSSLSAYDQHSFRLLEEFIERYSEASFGIAPFLWGTDNGLSQGRNRTFYIRILLTRGMGDTITVDGVSLVLLEEADVAPAGTEDARLVKLRFELMSFDMSGPDRGRGPTFNVPGVGALGSNMGQLHMKQVADLEKPLSCHWWYREGTFWREMEGFVRASIMNMGSSDLD